jgi:hypothetical protein
MVTTIDDVLDRMRAIQASLDPLDGVAVFNWVYQRVTEAVRDRLRISFFADPVFVEQFDVRFAKRYFAAVDADAAGQRPDPAWRPLFARRADRHIHAAQFAIAGLNTHINQDLSLAFVDACVAAGTHPRAGHIADDYQRVNDVIAEVEAEVRRELLNDLEEEIGAPFEPLLHLINTWSIAQAREAAWVRIQVLWVLRSEPWLFAQSVDATGRAVGMTSRHLLTPLLPAARRAVA